MKTKKIFDVSMTIGAYDDFINEFVGKQNGYTCFLNSHMLHEFSTSKSFVPVIKEADFVVPDGTPVLYSLKLFSNQSKIDRVAGNDVFFSLVEEAKRRNLRIFCFGSSEDVLSKISFKLNELKVGHKTFSPAFKPIEEFDFEEHANMINEYNPDMVFVGLGCPKQEIWMNRMKDRINAPMYGLGGAFLLFAGIDSRAPKWMRTLSLEWFYRLILEPRRLFKRYLITNTYFCYLFVKEVLKHALKSK